MKSDSFFLQGTTHEVCEDYAVHGQNHTIISDGCSNGGGPRIDTDWGARILCKTAQLNLDMAASDSINDFLMCIGSECKAKIRTIGGLSLKALTATLLGQFVYGNKVESFAVGDGIIGGKRKDGRWKIHVINFVEGGERNLAAPYYLKYKVCGEVKEYIKNFGGTYKITTYFGDLLNDEMEYPETKDLPREREEWIEFEENRMSVWGQMMSETEISYNISDRPFFHTSFPTEEYEYTFQCSDGAESFKWYRTTDTVTRTKESIHVLDVLRIMFNIRNFNMPFLKRMAHWNFKGSKKGTFLRRQWFNEDDVSAGVIYCG